MEFLYTAAKPEAPSASTLRGAQRADEEDEGDLNKALGVQRFQQIISPAPRIPDEQHRTYSEEDFEYHRHSSHHIHHPLSKLHFEGRRKSGKKKKKESDRKDNSGPTSSTTIEEGEDEEDNEEEGGESHTHLSETYCDTVKEDVQFFLSDEDHLATPTTDIPCPARGLEVVPQSAVSTDPEDATSTEKPCPASSSSDPSDPTPLIRVASRSYDLQERRCTGNMTGAEQAKYERIPTDESEAQTLASADLDGIKSEC